MAQQADDLPEPITRPEDDWMLALLDYAEQLADEFERTPEQVTSHVAALALTDRAWPEQLVQQNVPRWTVTDDGSAEWAMGKVVDAEQALAALGAQAQVWRDEAAERLARIDAWFVHAAKRHRATQAFMAAHLEAYALDRREADPKHNKTLVVPSGAVKTTEHKPRAVVEDEAQVAAWVSCWYPKDSAEVCPPRPPKVYVDPLRKLTTVVEVIDHARLVLANSAEVVEWVRSDWLMDAHADQVNPGAHTGDHCPQKGDGWPTPDEATDLVAMVQVLASHPEVHDPDGRLVPGTKVEPGGVTAKVVPAP